MQTKTPLIITFLSSILFGLLSYFGYSPDPQLSSDTIAFADQAHAAISAKNWIALGTSVITFVALAYVWWKDRQRARVFGGAGVIVLALMATLSIRPLRAVSSRSAELRPSKVEVVLVRPLPRFLDSLRC